jgi:hypothetical protein
MSPPADCHIWPAVWSLLPPWLHTEAVLGVSRAAVAEGDYSRLPILADALEEAGCDRADVLAHLRRAGPHVPGCWALHQIVLTDRPYSPPSPPLPPPPPQLFLGAPFPGIVDFPGQSLTRPTKIGKVLAYLIVCYAFALLLLMRKM